MCAYLCFVTKKKKNYLQIEINLEHIYIKLMLLSLFFFYIFKQQQMRYIKFEIFNASVL
jgi:hypothetical protein